MMFGGGPCIEGPGLVASNELRRPIRPHRDVNRDSVKHLELRNDFLFMNHKLICSLMKDVHAEC